MAHPFRSRRFSPIVLAFLSAAGASYAQQVAAPRTRVGALFVGETGVAPQIGAGAGDAMETISRQQGGDGTFNRKPGEDRPKIKDKPVAVTAPVVVDEAQGRPQTRPAPLPASEVTPAPAAPQTQTPAAPQELKAPASRPQAADRRRYSLWEGLSAPLELPGSKIKDVSADSALALSRKDYDAHILQAFNLQEGQSRAAGQTLSPSVPGVQAPPSSMAPARSREIFVAVDLDLKSHPGELKDAVAGLQKAADFRPDPRFEAKFSGPAGDKASIWGWLTADKVAAAMRAPSVSRLEIQSGAPRRAPSLSDGSVSEMLVGIRMSRQASPEVPAADAAKAALERVLPELASDAGFVWKRTLGTQQAPGTKESVVIIEGQVPLKNLSRVMAHPDVIKMVSSPDAGGASREVPAPETPNRQFLAFVFSRYPVVILLTVVLLLPSLGPSFSRFVEIFIPYRR